MLAHARAGDDSGCACPCAGCVGCAHRGRGSSGSSAAATGATAGAPALSAVVPSRGISGGATESGGAGAAGRARSTQKQRQDAARRQQQYRHRRKMLDNAMFGLYPGPVGSLVAPIDARIPAPTVRAMMQQYWRDASHQMQSALREKDRERRRMSEEIAALKGRLETGPPPKNGSKRRSQIQKCTYRGERGGGGGIHNPVTRSLSWGRD